MLSNLPCPYRLTIPVMTSTASPGGPCSFEGEPQHLHADEPCIGGVAQPRGQRLVSDHHLVLVEAVLVPIAPPWSRPDVAVRDGGLLHVDELAVGD